MRLGRCRRIYEEPETEGITKVNVFLTGDQALSGDKSGFPEWGGPLTADLRYLIVNKMDLIDRLVTRLAATQMARFQLRTLRRPMTGHGPVETSATWIDATSGEQAIAQAMFLVEATLQGWSGIATLSNETGALIWSMRKGMPRPAGPGTL